MRNQPNNKIKYISNSFKDMPRNIQHWNIFRVDKLNTQFYLKKQQSITINILPNHLYLYRVAYVFMLHLTSQTISPTIIFNNLLSHLQQYNFYHHHNPLNINQTLFILQHLISITNITNILTHINTNIQIDQILTTLVSALVSYRHDPILTLINLLGINCIKQNNYIYCANNYTLTLGQQQSFTISNYTDSDKTTQGTSQITQNQTKNPIKGSIIEKLEELIEQKPIKIGIQKQRKITNNKTQNYIKNDARRNSQIVINNHIIKQPSLMYSISNNNSQLYRATSPKFTQQSVITQNSQLIFHQKLYY